jgi:hypothetical protein
MWKAVSSRFIEKNRKLLDQCPDIPWDMPEYLGGPGLVPEGERKLLDCRIATIIIANKGKNGDVDKRLSVHKMTSSHEWNQHQVVMERLRSLNIDPVSFKYASKCISFDPESDEIMNFFLEVTDDQDLEDNFSHIYKLAVIDTLFTCRLPEIFGKKKFESKQFKNEKAFKKYLLYKNNLAWCNARSQVHLSTLRPRNSDEIDYERKERVVPVWTEESPYI